MIRLSIGLSVTIVENLWLFFVVIYVKLNARIRLKDHLAYVAWGTCDENLIC